MTLIEQKKENILINKGSIVSIIFEAQNEFEKSIFNS
jgi:hypothetical protein